MHSLGCALQMWDPQLEAFAARFRVIRYDTRGHGQSGLGAARELSIEQLGHDAIAILDALGVEKAHWCGLSLGGMTSMWAAVKHPQRVASLVLSNTSAVPAAPRELGLTYRDGTAGGHGRTRRYDPRPLVHCGFRASAPGVGQTDPRHVARHGSRPVMPPAVPPFATWISAIRSAQSGPRRS